MSLIEKSIQKDLQNICEKFSNIHSKLTRSEFTDVLYYLDLRFNKHNNKTKIRFSIQIINDEIQLQLLVEEQDERFLNKERAKEEAFRDSKGFSIRSSYVPEIYHFESSCIHIMGCDSKLISSQHIYYYYMFLQYIERVLNCFNEWAVSEYFKPKEEIEYAMQENQPTANEIKVYPDSELVMQINVSLRELNKLQETNFLLHKEIQKQIDQKIEYTKRELEMLENIKKDIDNKKY